MTTEGDNQLVFCASDRLLSRRAFLAALLAAAAVGAASDGGAAQTAVASLDIGDPVPADKTYAPGWLESLAARGSASIYSGAALEKIGMPIGGLCTGQLYLGGDGKLWRWNIFNQSVPSPGEGQWYLHAPARDYPVDQGFQLTVDNDPEAHPRNLDSTGFSAITFRGEYPLGSVTYSDPVCPVTVSLKAFSPFVPLDFDRSSFPATILRYTLKNTGSTPVKATIAGWMQNGSCLFTQAASTTRTNSIVEYDGGTTLLCGINSIGGTLPDAITTATDYGDMALALLGAAPSKSSTSGGVGALASGRGNPASVVGETPLVGAVAQTLDLAPGQSQTVDWIVAWWFPNLKLERLGSVGNYYGTRFSSALDVVKAISSQFVELVSLTDLWHNTWYDSTLPYWFLDRTFGNSTVLATTVALRFANGRFYGWEGVGLGVGTVTHVWHYAQAVARLFPELERDTRQRVDLGIALAPDTGVIEFRAEFDNRLAVDGQAGTILRCYREHQMTTNNDFLTANWSKIKFAFDPLFNLDQNQDGILEGPQLNTLDYAWYGQISWLSSLYVAALRAGAAMAGEMNDPEFQAKCQTIADAGTKNITSQLFNGEYYSNVSDPAHKESLNAGDGCEIDQAMGQSWAWKVGLPRVLPKAETVTALRSLYKYNFTTDVGPYRQVYPQGRWYAVAGEGGLLICSFPRPDWTFNQAIGSESSYAAGYFNECQSGYEHNAAAHMINEGLVAEGLAVERAIHDRYDGAKRNPWNEIEYGDHYARSMASYGVFLAACGYQYHGPKAALTFSPKITPENARFAFTTAEGWGTFAQTVADDKSTVSITVKYGQLQLKMLTLTVPQKYKVKSVAVELGAVSFRTSHYVTDHELVITFVSPVIIRVNETLKATLSLV